VGDTLDAGTEAKTEPITQDEFFRNRVPAECRGTNALRLDEL
jgi:hypothetical protein